MSYALEIFATCLGASIAIEIALVGFIVWGFLHEEKLVQFEDAVIRYIMRWHRRQKIRIKRKVVNKLRDIFLFIYLPYRRVKRKLLKRLLRQFGMRAVKAEQVNSYEVLSRE